MDAGHREACRGPSVAGKDAIRVLAEAAVFGLPIKRMLLSRDQHELDMLDAIRLECTTVVDELMTNLARKIVEEQARAQNRGKS